MTEDSEVLILVHERMCDGYFWRREIVYGSDHHVFWRVSLMDDPIEGWTIRPWAIVIDPFGGPARWQDLSALEKVAEKAQKKGWTAEWHPRYGPISKDFFVEVRH